MSSSHLDEPIWDGNGGTLDPRKSTQRDLLISLHIKVDRLVRDVGDHETRIRGVEGFNARLVGAGVFATVLSGLLGALIEAHHIF